MPRQRNNQPHYGPYYNFIRDHNPELQARVLAKHKAKKARENALAKQAYGTQAFASRHENLSSVRENAVPGGPIGRSIIGRQRTWNCPAEWWQLRSENALVPVYHSSPPTQSKWHGRDLDSIREFTPMASSPETWVNMQPALDKPKPVCPVRNAAVHALANLHKVDDVAAPARTPSPEWPFLPERQASPKFRSLPEPVEERWHTPDRSVGSSSVPSLIDDTTADRMDGEEDGCEELEWPSVPNTIWDGLANSEKLDPSQVVVLKGTEYPIVEHEATPTQAGPRLDSAVYPKTIAPNRAVELWPLERWFPQARRSLLSRQHMS